MYFYEFDTFNYINQNNRYKIEYKGNIYYFYCIINKMELFESLKLVYNKNAYYKVLTNKDGNIITNVGGKDYCLFKEEVSNFDFDLELSYYYISDSKLLNRSNWAKLWGDKIDYLEYQLLHIDGKYNILSDYVDYFIGMGEVAISYINNSVEGVLKTDMDRFCICHKRINDTDYFNPLNVVIDHKSRDYAEYLKFIFYNNSYKDKDLNLLLSNFKLSRYGFHLLFGRLLFNSYFFDKYDLIVNNIIKEEEILFIIKKIDEYEIYLKEIYLIINKLVGIKSIDFL